MLTDLTPKEPFLFCSFVHVPPVADHQHRYYGPVDSEHDPVIAYPKLSVTLKVIAQWNRVHIRVTEQSLLDGFDPARPNSI